MPLEAPEQPSGSCVSRSTPCFSSEPQSQVLSMREDTVWSPHGGWSFWTSLFCIRSTLFYINIGMFPIIDGPVNIILNIPYRTTHLGTSQSSKKALSWILPVLPTIFCFVTIFFLSYCKDRTNLMHVGSLYVFCVTYFNCARVLVSHQSDPVS